MSDFSRFMRQNKQTRATTAYAASQSFLDDDGKPIEWQLRPVSTARFQEIRDESTRKVRLPNGSYEDETDSNLLNRKLIAECVVYPDLQDAKLQSSYGVIKPEDLIVEMLDDFGEYARLLNVVLRLCGLRETLEDKVEEAKNF